MIFVLPKLYYKRYISRALHRAIKTASRSVVYLEVRNGFVCKEISDGVFQMLCPRQRARLSFTSCLINCTCGSIGIGGCCFYPKLAVEVG